MQFTRNWDKAYAKYVIFVFMKRILLIPILLMLCFSLSGQNSLSAYLEQLKGTNELKDAVWGFKACSTDGTVLAQYNSGTKMMPASNMKLISCGAAISELGPDFRFKTSIAFSGNIRDGVLKGDIYIVGGGDPTIGTSRGAGNDDLFGRWMQFIKQAGITAIEGFVVGDGRYFDCNTVNPSWQIEDVGTGDGAAMSGLGFAEGLQQLTLTASSTVGEKLTISNVYPETPWLEQINLTRSSDAGITAALSYDATVLAPRAILSGTLPAGTKKTITVANCFGALTCAYYFYRFLEQNGIDVSEGPADIDFEGKIRDFNESGKEAAPRGKLLFIGETFSVPLKEIARKSCVESDNYYAESLMKVLAREKTGSAAGSKALMDALGRLGLKNAADMQFNDGSGLSRIDYVSPDFMVSYLCSMSGCKDFIDVIPHAGQGTIASRVSDMSPGKRTRVKMKSGSMNGVRCFSGYIVRADGSMDDAVVFSLMINNSLAPAGSLNFIADKLVTLLMDNYGK